MAEARVSARVGSRTLSLSNLDKVLWPRDGYTKSDLVTYYERVAPFALAHLKERPLTLQRYPNGIDGEQFFEKQMPRGTPDWIDRVTVPTPGGSRSHVTFWSATMRRVSSTSRTWRRSCSISGHRALTRSTNRTL